MGLAQFSYRCCFVDVWINIFIYSLSVCSAFMHMLNPTDDDGSSGIEMLGDV